jgi:hypothetical protein
MPFDRVTFIGKGPALVRVILAGVPGQMVELPLKTTDTLGFTTRSTVSGFPGQKVAVPVAIYLMVWGEEVGFTGVPLIVPFELVTRPVMPPGFETT